MKKLHVSVKLVAGALLAISAIALSNPSASTATTVMPAGFVGDPPTQAVEDQLAQILPAELQLKLSVVETSESATLLYGTSIDGRACVVLLAHDEEDRPVAATTCTKDQSRATTSGSLSANLGTQKGRWAGAIAPAGYQFGSVDASQVKSSRPNVILVGTAPNGRIPATVGLTDIKGKQAQSDLWGV
jgi:hypothetical protein